MKCKRFLSLGASVFKRFLFVSTLKTLTFKSTSKDGKIGNMQDIIDVIEVVAPTSVHSSPCCVFQFANVKSTEFSYELIEPKLSCHGDTKRLKLGLRYSIENLQNGIRLPYSGCRLLFT